MGVSGTSAVAIKFKDGVMIATDTLGSYGSSAKYRNLQRQSVRFYSCVFMEFIQEACQDMFNFSKFVPTKQAIGNHSLMGFTGDYGDFQYFTRVLQDEDDSQTLEEDGIVWDAKQVYLNSNTSKRSPKFVSFHLLNDFNFILINIQTLPRFMRMPEPLCSDAE